MFEGLLEAFARHGQRPGRVLEAALGDVFPKGGRVLSVEPARPSGLRVVVDVEGEREGTKRPVVVKRLAPTAARRNALAFRSWLPAAGLWDACPAVLAEAAEKRGTFTWQVYEDPGEGALPDAWDRARLEAVSRLFAQLHSRFCGHPLLVEVRSAGGELGVPSFEASVSEALRCLGALAAGDLTHANRALVMLLTERLEGYAATVPARRELFDEVAGPRTLVHGSASLANACVADDGGRTCLTTWDFAASGAFTDDLATFLMQLPRELRASALDDYRAALEPGGPVLPDGDALNALFETRTVARLAGKVAFAALAVWQRGDAQAWKVLNEVERAFETLEPLLPSAADGERRLGT